MCERERPFYDHITLLACGVRLATLAVGEDRGGGCRENAPYKELGRKEARCFPRRRISADEYGKKKRLMVKPGAGSRRGPERERERQSNGFLTATNDGRRSSLQGPVRQAKGVRPSPMQPPQRSWTSREMLLKTNCAQPPDHQLRSEEKRKVRKGPHTSLRRVGI